MAPKIMQSSLCRSFFWTLVIYTSVNLLFGAVWLLEQQWFALVPMTTNGAALILTIANHRYASIAVRILAALLIASGIFYWLAIAKAGEIEDIGKTIEKTAMLAIGLFFFACSVKCARAATTEGPPSN